MRAVDKIYLKLAAALVARRINNTDSIVFNNHNFQRKNLCGAIMLTSLFTHLILIVHFWSQVETAPHSFSVNCRDLTQRL